MRKLNITIILVTHEMEVVKQITQKHVVGTWKYYWFDDTEELFLKPDNKMKKFFR